jgi:hypothetical protein
MDGRRHSNTRHVWPLRGPECDTDHYLEVAIVAERLSVSKQAKQKSDVEKFDLKKLNDVAVKEQY